MYNGKTNGIKKDYSKLSLDDFSDDDSDDGGGGFRDDYNGGADDNDEYIRNQQVSKEPLLRFRILWSPIRYAQLHGYHCTKASKQTNKQTYKQIPLERRNRHNWLWLGH